MKSKNLLQLLFLSMLIITVTSCSFKRTKGNGIITSNEITISDYNKLEVSGSSNLIYEQRADTAAYLRIEVDENIFPLLEIKSKDGVLSIDSKNGSNIDPTKFIIYTNSSALNKLSVAGATDIQLKNKLNTEGLSISLAGSSKMKSDSIICESMNMNIAGSGEINIIGTANKVNYKVAGSGKVEAFNMIADSVKCKVAGSGDISLYAEKNLNVEVAGSGDIKYKGNPQISQSIAGSGKVVQIN